MRSPDSATVVSVEAFIVEATVMRFPSNLVSAANADVERRRAKPSCHVSGLLRTVDPES